MGTWPRGREVRRNLEERTMWQRQTEPNDRTPKEGKSQRSRNVLIVFLLLCVTILFLASTLPPVLVPPALSQLLAISSFAAATVALFCRERALVRHLTHWDQSAAFMALSLLAGLFTDAAAVNAFLESLSVEGFPDTPVMPENVGPANSPT